MFNALESIKRNRFAVLGRAGMDFYADPPGVSLESASRFTACLGGSSANIAVAIVKHGGACSLITSVSDDAIGRFCLNELARYGVDCTHVRSVSGGASNSLAVADSKPEGHQCVLYRNGAADFRMNRDDVAEVDYASFGALITTGTVFAAEPSRGAAFLSLDIARQSGLALVFDIDYRPYSWTSPEVAAETLSRAGEMCDVIIGNDVEFEFMAGENGKGLEKARELAKAPNRISVYKMGHRGAITFSQEKEMRTGVYEVNVINPIGAGDGFMGGFISALADGRPLKECVLRGSASAAIVVNRVGCSQAMPTARELDEFLAKYPGPTTQLDED
ncbi:MAG: 5-dehydro-2-deoxygluconokinase [Albidovulum sp.]|nr:5-dehydro-2-deoxygluconokinase [Albidovulum sp.]